MTAVILTLQMISVISSTRDILPTGKSLEKPVAINPRNPSFPLMVTKTHNIYRISGIISNNVQTFALQLLIIHSLTIC